MRPLNRLCRKCHAGLGFAAHGTFLCPPCEWGESATLWQIVRRELGWWVGMLTKRWR